MSTDKAMKDATQVGYLSFLIDARESLVASGEEGPFSVRELMIEAEKQNLINEKDKKILENINEEVLNWNVVGIYDANDKNGLYACVLETSEDNAIVAFRGSENMKDFDNLMDDWIQADIGLLFNTTEQQKETEEFLKLMKENGTLDEYDTLEVTGHSLGGNLATHFGIICAKEGNEEIFNKITKVVDLDGPGFSKEYLEENKEHIEKLISSKVYNDYNWSCVGNLLNPISEENIEYLGVDDSMVSTLNSEEYDLMEWIVRHDTRNVIFDEEGNAIRGEQDIHSQMLEQGSLKIEDMIKDQLPQYLSEILPDWIPQNIIENTPGIFASIVGWTIDQQQGERDDAYIVFQDSTTIGNTGIKENVGITHWIMNIMNFVKEAGKKIAGQFKGKEGLLDVFEFAENNLGLNKGLVENAINVFNNEKRRRYGRQTYRTCNWINDKISTYINNIIIINNK